MSSPAATCTTIRLSAAGRENRAAGRGRVGAGSHGKFFMPWVRNVAAFKEKRTPQNPCRGYPLVAAVFELTPQPLEFLRELQQRGLRHGQSLQYTGRYERLKGGWSDPKHRPWRFFGACVGRTPLNHFDEIESGSGALRAAPDPTG